MFNSEDRHGFFYSYSCVLLTILILGNGASGCIISVPSCSGIHTEEYHGILCYGTGLGAHSSTASMSLAQYGTPNSMQQGRFFSTSQGTGTGLLAHSSTGKMSLAQYGTPNLMQQGGILPL